MKKYLIKLVSIDIQDDRQLLINCNRILARMPDDTFWIRKKQSLENKILKHESLLAQLKEMKLISKPLNTKVD